MFIKWPSTFIPDEDEGYMIIAAQLPPASSLTRS
jgi:multidrug efflux pump subunit AcrB